MSYYHYTTLNAFSSILQDNPTKGKEICFWATRYDCFVDKMEYLYGINKIRPILEYFEDQHSFQQDRRISLLFDTEEIVQAMGLPVPYVISISARKDNDFMWSNYADNGDGVVLELDFPKPREFYENAALYSIESCIYDSSITIAELHKLIKDKYFEMAGIMLGGFKELALGLLRDRPDLFVRVIAMYLLIFVAPRFKKDEFSNEEETRIIVASPTSKYNELFNNVIYPHQLKPLIDIIKSFVAKERKRPDNNKFYREVFMPIQILKRIYVRNVAQKEKANMILFAKGYTNIPVEILCRTS